MGPNSANRPSECSIVNCQSTDTVRDTHRKSVVRHGTPSILSDPSYFAICGRAPPMFRIQDVHSHRCSQRSVCCAFGQRSIAASTVQLEQV